MPASYAVRVSRANADLSGCYEKISRACDKCVVYEHPDEGNVHVHMLLVDCSISTDTLKNYIRAVVGNVSRTEWSFKSGADLGFISYMSKGKYDAVFISGIDDALVQEYKAKGYDKGGVFMQSGRLVKPAAEGKKTKRELIELMVSRFEPHCTIPNMIKMIRKVLIENNEVIGNFKVMDYVDAVMMRSDKVRWLDNMVMLYDRRYNK